MTRSRYLDFWEGKYSITPPARRTRRWRWHRNRIDRLTIPQRLARFVADLVGA